jgi:hypothetical protein
MDTTSITEKIVKQAGEVGTTLELWIARLNLLCNQQTALQVTTEPLMRGLSESATGATDFAGLRHNGPLAPVCRTPWWTS